MVALAALLPVSPASALTCAREWGGDTLASAPDAVAAARGWDGLVLGTISAVERKDDHWEAPVLTVQPEVVFAGSFPDVLRLEIGGHGPDMAFATGGRYFLALEHSADPAGWFVHPCGPNMEITGNDQLAQLRASSSSEVVIVEPLIPSPPTALWIAGLAAFVTLAGAWVARRTGSTVASTA